MWLSAIVYEVREAEVFSLSLSLALEIVRQVVAKTCRRGINKMTLSVRNTNELVRSLPSAARSILQGVLPYPGWVEPT